MRLCPSAVPAVSCGCPTVLLRVQASGDTFTVWTNGCRLFSISDDAYSSGRIGLMTADEVPAVGMVPLHS